MVSSARCPENGTYTTEAEISGTGRNLVELVENGQVGDWGARTRARVGLSGWGRGGEVCER